MLVAVQLSVLGLYSRRCSMAPAASNSTPDDHFTAGPYGRVNSRPVGALVVLVAVQLSVAGLYLPPVLECKDFHPRRSFHCQSILPCEGFAQWARWWC